MGYYFNSIYHGSRYVGFSAENCWYIHVFSLFLHENLYCGRDVELSNFITCPQTGKWSKSTCPTKIYLPKNWEFFLFFEENIFCGYSLEVALLMSTHMFSSRNKKNIYLIIWILFCQSYLKLLVPGQVNWKFLLVLREMGQVGHGISTALIVVLIRGGSLRCF